MAPYSLHGGRIPIRVVTHKALEYTFARARQRLSTANVDRLMARWEALEPLPEADATLAELNSRGYSLGLLWNGGEDMLRAALSKFEVKFDYVFASDHVGFYKPHPAIYALPKQKLGFGTEDMLHVAGSGNDVLGAKLSGLHCAWSNRGGDRMIDPDVKPDYDLGDLAGLLEIL